MKTGIKQFVKLQDIADTINNNEKSYLVV
jgi:hypothetical protein